MIEKPQIVRTAAINTAVIHLVIPRSELRSEMGPAHKELMIALAEQGIALAGPWFTHHLRLVPNIFDFELGVPVTSPCKPLGRVKPSQLPAGTVARIVYQGNYDGIPSAWSQLNTWIKAQNRKHGPNLWENYIIGPEANPDPTTWRTELNRPLIG